MLFNFEEAIIPPSPKQIYSVLNSNSRINVWSGSVRSGKTWSVNVRIVKEIRDLPAGWEGMLVGKSREALQRNVVTPLCTFLGMSPPADKCNKLVLWDRKIHLVGASDERAQDKIAGSTLGCASVDEGSLIPYGFFKMLQSRLSKRDAKVFITTNPESPYHWLKKEIIDNEDLDVSTFNFRLDDNPTLDATFLENIKKEYTGIWYKRYILGEWAMAEGAVYDFFDEDIHIIDYPPTKAREYIVGIDYGTANPCVYVLIGIDYSQFPNMWCEKEYVFDSSIQNRQKTDSDYASDLAKFINGYNVTAIYVDPSAASFKLECRRAGIYNILEAENDVLNGIRFQTQHLQNGSYKICRCCTRTIQEYGNYLWDIKAANQGVERPLKLHDHCFAMGTFIMTDRGNIAIEQLKDNDLILTRDGYKPIFSHGVSRTEDVFEFDIDSNIFRCTKDHKFFTENRGFIPIGDLMPKDILYIISPCVSKLSNSKEKNIEDTPNHPIVVIKNILNVVEKFFTVRFGKKSLEKSPQDTTFTTKTSIPVIMKSKILKSSKNPNIAFFTPPARLKGLGNCLKNMVKRCWKRPQNGTPHPKGSLGIESTGKIHGIARLDPSYVSFAATNMQASQGEDFAPTNANLLIDEQKDLTMLPKNVWFAQNNSQKTNTQKLPVARSHVVKNIHGTFLSREKVYNLTVFEKHEYFANGVLVLNCQDAQRYALYTHLFNRSIDRLKPEDIDQWRAEGRGYPNMNLPPFFQ